MATRRIEGEQHSPAAAASAGQPAQSKAAAAGALQPAQGKLADAKPPEQGKPADTRRSETAAAADPELAGLLDFEAPVDSAGRRTAGAPDDLDFAALIESTGRRTAGATILSPGEYIADFIRPRISNRALFQGRRSLSILERLASDIIPNLDENAELRSLAGAVIADEIDRHRELATRQLHSGVAR
jgi:hypothetical protein